MTSPAQVNLASEEDRHAANAAAVSRLAGCRPMLVDVAPARNAVPGMTARTILTSGAPLAWPEYWGVHRNAILGGAVFEGLAGSAEEADSMIADGEIELRPCHDHGCVGSVTGVCTASMPVFVVEDPATTARAFCTIYEGPQRERLTYGSFSPAVAGNLAFIRDEVAPLLKDALTAGGPVDLLAVARRALLSGDELHSRNTAATLFFLRELLPRMADLGHADREPMRRVLGYLGSSDLFFLHLGMAMAKLTADAASGIAGSSVVTAMSASCREFSIRVSGLGDEWFRAPTPVVQAKVFDGFSQADVAPMPGESLIMETIGLGGSAAAAAFALRAYSGSTPERMIQQNLDAYRFSVAEHPQLTIPYFGGRGTSLGVDIFRVAETQIAPKMHAGVANQAGLHIGAGIMAAPLECFEKAVRRYGEVYGSADGVALPKGARR